MVLVLNNLVAVAVLADKEEGSFRLRCGRRRFVSFHDIVSLDVDYRCRLPVVRLRQWLKPEIQIALLSATIPAEAIELF